MTTENNPNEKPLSAAPSPAMASCRKKKHESATFLEDVKDRINEFIHASMDEHKACFQYFIKMYGGAMPPLIPTVPTEKKKKNSETKELES